MSRKASRKGSGQLKGDELAKIMRRDSVSAAAIKMEGYLEKKAATLTGAENYQSRYFVLSGHYLRYYSDKSSLAEDPRGVYDMHTMQVLII